MVAHCQRYETMPVPWAAAASSGHMTIRSTRTSQGRNAMQLRLPNHSSCLRSFDRNLMVAQLSASGMIYDSTRRLGLDSDDTRDPGSNPGLFD